MRCAIAAVLLATGLFAPTVEARQVVPCDGLIAITMITEPWEGASRTYANGAIRVFEAVTNPAGVAAAVIGVLHDVPGDPWPVRTCTAVLGPPGVDAFFAEAHVAAATARYDPSRGLTIRVPVSFPDLRQPFEAVSITINQATGTVVAR